MDEDDDVIPVIGANEALFDEEERLLSTPITGRGSADVGGPPDVIEIDPPQSKGKVTSASMARAMQQMKREQQRIKPAYDHIEALIGRAIIDDGEASVIVDLLRFMLEDDDIGKIKDSYASAGWKIEVGPEPYALTFSLPS
jgi:hypothetical protein